MPTIEDLQREEVGKDHKVMDVTLIVDNPGVRLESYYFWLLDFMRDSLKLEVEKLADDFGASVGSFFFGEMGSRMAALLAQGRQLGELINGLAKSIISLLNEYKLIENRLKLYDDIKSKDIEAADAAYKSLKSIWMDTVDSQKGGAALLNLSRGKLGYVTLPDLFMLYDIPDKLKRLRDLGVISKELHEKLIERDIKKPYEDKIINVRVYNIVRARLEEFYNWLVLSEKELRNRKSILRAYLKHQINAFVTYTEFARPYFRAARKLLMKEYNTPEIVKVFETALIELSLFGKGKGKKIKITENGKEVEEEYFPLYEVSLKFRSIPTLTMSTDKARMYSFIGRVDINFRAYVVSKKEYEEMKIDEEIKDLLYIKGMTDDFLRSLSEAIVSIYLWDYIQSDKDLKNTIAKELNKKEEEIKRPEDIDWNEKIVDIVISKYKDSLSGLEWIKKYLKDINKKTEDKKENKKNNNSKSSISNVFPFSEVLGNILKFIIAFPKKFSFFENKYHKSLIEKEKQNTINKLKSSAIGLEWTIYDIFKREFRLLAP